MSTSPVQAGSFDPAWPDDAVEVGRVLDAWGVKGWLKVQPFAADPQALFSTKRWFIKPPEAQAGGAVKRPMPAAAASSYPSLLKVTEAREHGDGVVAHVQDVVDRNGAEALRGARIFVARSSFPTADADEYYWVDLIGMSVVNREGERLGTVIGLIDTGPHSVLRVEPDASAAGAAPVAADKKAADKTADKSEDSERLIPFVGAYIDDVSMADKRITVDWGLDY